MGNIVAIVGRPNVGKSTLFNRLTKTREAIEDPTSGVTRDRHYGTSDWNGKYFSVIDTGGYVINSDDIFEQEILRQVQLAIDEADIILFLVDIMEGVTPLDEEAAMMLRKTNKPIFLVANKADNFKLMNNAGEFYQFGLGEVYCISSINGSGTGDLLDVVVAAFKEEEEEEPEKAKEAIPRFTVVGRPNVGKSSIVNTLLEQDRNIVTDIAGTTRDSVYTRFNKFGFDFFLIDTAGLRKKGKVHENIEFYSVLRSIRAIENSDVCLLVIDATQGFEAQDQNILHLIEKNMKGVVIVVNKWDLVEKDTHSMKKMEEEILSKTAPFTDIPIIFTSALTKQRVIKAFETAVDVYKNKSRRITTSVLNETMLPLIQAFHPPSVKDKHVQIKYVTQLPTPAPSFAFFCNLPQYIRAPYKNYLENRIREHFNFKGVPINIFFRQK